MIKSKSTLPRLLLSLTNDHVTVEGASGQVYADYSGSYTSTWSPWVTTGNNAIIRLTSNGSVNAYGFLVDKYVTNDTAYPVSGARVVVGSRTVSTDANGIFDIRDIAPGTYTVTVAKYGWSFDPDSITVSLSSDSTTTADFWGIKEGEVLDSIAEAKHRTDDSLVALPMSPVTATYSDCFYVEDTNRTAGIRINTTYRPILEGNSVAVVGRLTTINGERVVIMSSSDLDSSTTTTIKPLGMNALAVVGAKLGSSTPGAEGAVGLNNSGLLVRVYGRISGATSSGFYLDDGSNIDNGSEYPGIWVSTTGLYSSRSINTYSGGEYVTVTGIAATTSIEGKLRRIIKPRQQSDIRQIQESQ